MFPKKNSLSRYIGISCYQASIQAPHDNTQQEGQKATQQWGWDTETEQSIKEVASWRATT